jgi:hypothetical protein
MSFQPSFAPDQTFKSTNQVEIPEIEKRTDKFQIRETPLTKDTSAMEEYRNRWTQGNHTFDRTYLGKQE